MLRVWLLGAVALLLLAQQAHAFIQLDPSNGQFVDSATGSTRIFHGVNVVYKQFPYLPCYNCEFDPQLSLNAQDIANLQAWGINMVRLGVMWVSVEPSPGVYNYTFLSEAAQLVKALGEAGIVTLVDMHQDLLSPMTCGEGIPRHVAQTAMTARACNESALAELAHQHGVCKSISEYGMRTDPTTGDPLPEDCVKHLFSLFYPSPEVSSMFQSLYDNRAGVADAFRAYWNVTASTFAGMESVLGYDLLNEPWAGDVWTDVLDIAVPGRTDQRFLQPLYESLAGVIRRVDPQHLIFYEPVPTPDSIPLFGGLVSPVGFNSTPGGAAGAGQDVMSYHIYCCEVGMNACDSDGNPSVQDAVCDKYNTNFMDMRMKDQKRLGGGGMLTEFGACTTGPACVAEIARTAAVADAHLQSWAYWQLKYFDDVTTSSGPKEGFYHPDGTLVQDKVQALTRTYAQVVQGRPTAMAFNTSTGAFTLTYEASTKAQAPTSIYVNRLWWYPGSGKFVVQLQPQGLVDWMMPEDDQTHIILKHSPELSDGAVVSVNIQYEKAE